MNETILICVLSGFFGLLGVLIGVWSTSAAAERTARLEERKHYRELGVAVGRAKFDYSLLLAQKVSDASGKFIPIPPLEAHLIHGIRLMELISDHTLSAEELGKRIIAIKDFAMTATNANKNP